MMSCAHFVLWLRMFPTWRWGRSAPNFGYIPPKRTIKGPAQSHQRGEIPPTCWNIWPHSMQLLWFSHAAKRWRATLAGEPVAQRLPSPKSQVTQGSQVSRIERDSRALRSFVTHSRHTLSFSRWKKYYNIDLSAALLSLWKRQETSTSPMTHLPNNNTNNDIINERPPFLRPVQLAKLQSPVT